MKHKSELWTFHVDDPTADRIFLVIDRDGEVCRWFPMQRVDDWRWEVTLVLFPGRHRLRYYRFVGQTCINAGSNGLISRRLSGQDQGVRVEADARARALTCGHPDVDRGEGASEAADGTHEDRSSEQVWPAAVKATQHRLRQINGEMLEVMGSSMRHEDSQGGTSRGETIAVEMRHEPSEVLPPARDMDGMTPARTRRNSSVQSRGTRRCRGFRGRLRDDHRASSLSSEMGKGQQHVR